MPRASSRSSVEGLRELVARGHDERLGGGGVGVDLGPHEPELDAERDEALLRAVVQVALEPPALGVARCDDALPRGPQLAEPLLGLGVELLVLDGDGGRGAHRVDDSRSVHAAS